MAKMKVFEIKNMINEKTQGSIESKDIQRFLEKNMGVKKTHSSNLDEHEIKAVREHFVSSASKTSETPATKKVRSVGHNNEKPNVGGGQGYPQGDRRPTGQSMPRQDGTGQGRPQGQAPRGQGYNQGDRRPVGQGMPRQDGTGQGRPQGQAPRGQGPRGPMSPGGSQGYQDRRPAGQGAPRQDGYGQGRPQGDAARGQRPPQGAGQGYQGQGNRPQTTGRPDGQQRYQGQSGRPQQQDQRPAGNRPQGGGYNTGNRPQGGGYNTGNRPQGGGYNSGDRPQGGGYNTGNRPQGGGYNTGNRPQGGGYNTGNRPQGGGYNTGNRPQGGGYNTGNRPQGGYNSGTGARPNNSQGNYQRPAGYQGGGQRGGYNTRGNEGYNKDEDTRPAYGNRAQGNRRGGQPQRGSDRKSFDQQILDQKVAEKNDFNNKRNRDRMNRDRLYKDKGTTQHNKGEKGIENLVPKKGQFIKPKPVVVVKEEIKVIHLPEILTIKELSDKMKIPGAALVKKLFLAGKVVTINQEITYEEAEEIALEYDIISEKEIVINEVEELLKEEEEDPATLVKRPPVVCVMGHVDHGKTSLLDAIRKANVTSREAGGITQHIGAYIVEVKDEKIAFLDTPGHEAFTSMRMRGAKATDIAILVVAADDGVMPQTVEAINHAKAAGVQIIVAINKIDKPSANVERVKQELTEHELIAEDWGGDTIFVPVSAHTQEGIPQLLEMVLLTAEIEELKANPDRAARGIVIEAELDKGRGPVATILVQKGTLRVGDNVAVGSSYGKVRAMVDDKGRRVEEAAPSTPVEILGLNTVPDVGEIIMATDNEKEARNIAEAFISQGKERLIADTKAKLSLDGLFSQIKAGNIKELNLIIKADVQGSVEAMKQSLYKLSNDEVAIRVIHGGVGAINESDVILASTSNGIIIGFNVKPDNRAKEIAEYENVDIKLYHVIYDAINDVESAMKGLLDPIYEEKIIGHAEIRQTFKSSGVGTIAGSYVLDGKITRGCKVRIYRGKDLVHEGNLGSLKRFQDDVREVASGYECGLVFEKYNDVKEEDKVEFYIMVEVPR